VHSTQNPQIASKIVNRHLFWGLVFHCPVLSSLGFGISLCAAKLEKILRINSVNLGDAMNVPKHAGAAQSHSREHL
jgi:hypothetical protein